MRKWQWSMIVALVCVVACARNAPSETSRATAGGILESNPTLALCTKKCKSDAPASCKHACKCPAAAVPDCPGAIQNCSEECRRYVECAKQELADGHLESWQNDCH